MTSTTTGLPDRYRPLDQVAADEETPTGVIRSWRARDRVLNRDVSLRVHTPGGPAAREWISRALTAGGLATPALSMVYDAAEGTSGTEAGSAAYVVNEWIEGTRLSDRLATDGPLPEREARALVRRLAEGVAEAHRVGLAVGGLTPDHVVLRPGGLVGLVSVPAASGTERGDIAALGALLELCLTGTRSDAGPAPIASPDLAALVRRARSADPATGLSSVSTMVAMLAAPPRVGTDSQEAARPDDTGWVRRRKATRDLADDARKDAEGPVRLDRGSLPPVPGAPARRPAAAANAAAANASADSDDDLDWGGTFSTTDERTDDDRGPSTSARRRLAVIGLPLLALALVIAFALWFGNNVLSVAGNVDQVEGSAPSPGTTAVPTPASSAPPPAPVAGAPVQPAGGAVFNPFGDGEPENDDDVDATVDGDPGTGWSTVTYRGSAAFGNLKPGVGVLYDLGGEQTLAGVTIATSTPGATVEVRTGGTPGDDLDAFTVSASSTLSGTDDLTFSEPVTTEYLLVWLTGLVETDGGFSADVTEITVRAAG